MIQAKTDFQYVLAARSRTANDTKRPFLNEAREERILDAFAAEVIAASGPDAALRGWQKHVPVGATYWGFLIVPLVVALVVWNWVDTLLAIAFLFAPMAALGLLLWEKLGPDRLNNS